MYQVVKDGMLAQYNAVVSQPLGFNNTLCHGRHTGCKYNLQTLSDLFAIAGQMRLGSTNFVHLEDCLPKMQSQYNIQFKQVSALQSNPALSGDRGGRGGRGGRLFHNSRCSSGKAL